MTPNEKPCRLQLTHRALRDLNEIYDYSLASWNEDVAEKYLDDIQAPLTRIQTYPGLLTRKPEFSEHLRFYVVNQHTLVCDQKDDSIVVLTVAKLRMDLIDNLERLQPTLAHEVEFLRRDSF